MNLDDVISLGCFFGLAVLGTAEVVTGLDVKYMIGLAFAAGTIWYKVNRLEKVIGELDSKYVRRRECQLHHDENEGDE
jgi:hypothetical protein